MLPPTDPTVIASNIKFEALHRDLCSTKLNDDGTSKSDSKAQNALSEELRRARVSIAKENVLKQSISRLAYSKDELPDELRELVIVIAASLHLQAGSKDTLLLRDDIDNFKGSTQSIAAAISKHLAQDISTLSQLISADDTTGQHDPIAQIEQLKEDIATHQIRLSSLRLDIAHEASDLQAIYGQCFELSIRVLEQTVHGSVSRGTRAKVDYLATVAEGMSKKLELQRRQLLSHAREPEFLDAIESKQADLAQESLALKRKIRDAEAKLAEFERNKAVEGMAKEYAEILVETERVRAEVARLETR